MFEWIEGLTVLQKVFFYTALPFSLVLIIQIILSLVGLGHGGADGADGADADGDGVPDQLDADGDGVPDGLDADGDGIPDAVDADGDGVPDTDGAADGIDPGFRLLTLRGVVAFFVMFGWTGLCLSTNGASDLLSLGIGLLVGLAALGGMAFLLRALMRLQEDGTLRITNAVGKSASVYLTIPPRRSGTGKVNVLVQERYVELSAVTDCDAPLPSGSEVLIIGVSGENTVVVTHK